MNVKRTIAVAIAAASIAGGVSAAPANAEIFVPDTEGAIASSLKTINGSTNAGSSVEDAYNWTQFGWFVLWATVAASGLSIIGLVAQAAGVLPAGTIPLPR